MSKQTKKGIQEQIIQDSKWPISQYNISISIAITVFSINVKMSLCPLIGLKHRLCSINWKISCSVAVCSALYWNVQWLFFSCSFSPYFVRSNIKKRTHYCHHLGLLFQRVKEIPSYNTTQIWKFQSTNGSRQKAHQRNNER